jgi:hypothetical protein
VDECQPLLLTTLTWSGHPRALRTAAAATRAATTPTGATQPRLPPADAAAAADTASRGRREVYVQRTQTTPAGNGITGATATNGDKGMGLHSSTSELKLSRF